MSLSEQKNNTFWQRNCGMIVIMFFVVGVPFIIAFSITYYNDLTKTQSELTIVSKTLVSESRSQHEACVLDYNGQRIIADNNGCAYEIGQRVIIEFNGGTKLIKGLP